MPTEPVDVDPMTGEDIFNETQTICPFIYDHIAGNEQDYIDNVILVKEGKEGFFSCSQRKIIVDCVIPTSDHCFRYVILPHTYGEGLIGCCEQMDDKNSFSFVSRYYFSDMEGNRVLEVPNEWIIESGFENGYAQITSYGSFQEKTASIDKSGKITITKVEKRQPNNNSGDDIDSIYRDIDNMYRDAFEDDPNMEWNID